ncbi:MAG: polysaccharide biosynthesis/export family protein [Moheibacter sp.]
MKPIRIVTYFFVFISVVISCIPLKDIQYIQPDEKLKLNEYGMIVENRPTYHLQRNDLINIRITTRNSDMLNMFQDYTTQSGPSGSSGKSVLIQEDGNIELPRIGKIHLEGLELQEAREKIESEFYKIFNPEAAYIEVIMPGINFTIVGEAASGNYFVPRYDFNLLEAFAMAGNLSDVADRKRIQILRTTPQGSHRVEVDITQESVMNSEYFWLQPNDVIIVNPKRQKQWGIGLNPIQTVSTVFGAVATVIGIFFFFKNL